MGQVQALRPVHSLVSIPVEQAIYCRHCKTLSERCGKCGSELVLHLATLVDQPPAGPDSGPAAAVRIVPAFDLELARAA